MRSRSTPSLRLIIHFSYNSWSVLPVRRVVARRSNFAKLCWPLSWAMGFYTVQWLHIFEEQRLLTLSGVIFDKELVNTQRILIPSKNTHFSLRLDCFSSLIFIQQQVTRLYFLHWISIYLRYVVCYCDDPATKKLTFYERRHFKG